MEKTDFLPTLLIGMYGDLMSTHYRVNVIDYLIDIKQKLGLEYGKIKRTESRFFTLLPCDEAVSLKDAAQAVGIQYKNLNKYLNGLIKNGYFEKFYDNEKARIMLKMTDKGKEILNENSLVCAAIMQERISCSLTREEAYDLRKLCARLSSTSTSSVRSRREQRRRFRQKVLKKCPKLFWKPRKNIRLTANLFRGTSPFPK